MTDLPAYLLITYGPKHQWSVEDMEAAKGQLNTLRTVAARNDLGFRVSGHDYARRVSSFDDLTTLFDLLEKCVAQSGDEQGNRSIVIDDYNRLFKNTDQSFRGELWCKLREYSDHILSAGHRKRLDELSQTEVMLLTQASLPINIKSKRSYSNSALEKQAQTAKARKTSAHARVLSGQKAAKQLCDALEAYRQDHPEATIKSFIESQEGAKLVNSNGRPWTAKTAPRAIKNYRTSLEKEEEQASPV